MPRRPPPLVVALFFVVTGLLFAAWALAVPVFESPDEPSHWQYARYLRDRWELPHYRQGFEEANSPPLYYLAIAPFATESKLPPMVVVNDVRERIASLAPPRNFLNTDRDWTWYRPVLAARLWTALLSMLTVWFVYRAAASLMSGPGALATAAMAAFLPQFTFRASTVSNDAAVTLFAAMLTMLCVHLLTRGFTWTRGTLAAVALAAAYLSKILAIGLALPLVLALLEAEASTVSAASTANTPNTPNAAKTAKVAGRERVGVLARVPRLAVLLVALAIVLPWSLRNVMLYGDPTAQHAMRTAVSHLITDRSLFSGYFLWHFPLVTFASFIGLFGWMSVLLPRWIYVAFAGFGLIAAAGVVRGWSLRAIDPRVLRMLISLVVAALAMVVYINLMFTQPQGRYMLQALPAVALLTALGLTHLPAPLGSRLIVAAPIVMLLFNVWCLAGVIVPTYWPPLARTIAPGVRIEHPVTVHELAFHPRPAENAGRNLLFDITGNDPWAMVVVDIDASEYDTIEIELTGELPGGTDARGAVQFTRAGGEWSRMPMAWRADGTRQVVRVPLSKHARWRGPITHLLIEPIDEEQPPAAAAGANPTSRAGTPALNRGRIELGAITLRVDPGRDADADADRVRVHPPVHRIP